VTGALGQTVAKFVSSVLGEFGGTIVLITCLLLMLLTELRQAARAGLRMMGRTPEHRETISGWMGAASGWVGRSIAAMRERRERGQEVEAETARWGRSTPPAPAEPRGSASTQVPGDAPWFGVDREEQPKPRTAARVQPSRRPVAPAGVVRPAVAAGDGIPLEKATLPPLSMLKVDAATRSGYSADQLKSWSEVLEGKLSNYGIEGRVTAVNQGPLVTTFEFEPAPGVKVKDIVSRSDDLALAMRARSLRLIAPIPGRAVVGIEIPNPDQHTVYFHDIFKEIPERLRYSGIMIALGVDAIGKPFHMNLCGAPHLLMAGTTGSGKSVALDGFLASILFQYRPSDVRLLIIDPKMVEMSMFNGIPHLLHPVITDPREAVRTFNYLIAEMDRRNHLLRKNGVKNIESFNSKIALGKMEAEEPLEKLPYIVLIVDELADLVLTKGIDFESLLSRLSNMARAVGIHMIVATQRPSVDIIDGKTKANFPTRIAFRVASKVDSRTILDCMGAEKLLGKGDMLYVDAKHPEAIRLHGSWLAEEELEDLVNHWRQYEFEESHLEFFEETREAGSSNEKDSYFEDARDVILRYGQGSTSLLQRKLHVGYARAARLLDQLEEAGVVGPPDGSKPREVLIRKEEEIGRNLHD
jgi:S-DNA-T family DNA segregation ATPase FtsK/SpoIIIE